jgi:hypothetical protein
MRGALTAMDAIRGRGSWKDSSSADFVMKRKGHRYSQTIAGFIAAKDARESTGKCINMCAIPKNSRL